MGSLNKGKRRRANERDHSTEEIDGDRIRELTKQKSEHEKRSKKSKKERGKKKKLTAGKHQTMEETTGLQEEKARCQSNPSHTGSLSHA